MNMEALLEAINHPQPDVRISAARVLGTVEETRALGVVGQRYKTESDPAVREALAWAGQRIHAAHQAGHSTVNEIFRHFGIDREIANREDESEAELMKKLEDNFTLEMMRKQSDAAVFNTGLKAATMIGGALTGLPLGGITSMMQPGAEVAASNLGVKRPETGKTRVPAAAPSSADISVWVRRLRGTTEPDQRAAAAMELVHLNNPAALPILAALFLSDSAPQVREAAQRAAKQLYWGAVYWTMEKDGSLAQEMDRRAALLGKPGEAKPDPTPPPAPQQDINAILRQAEAARARRGKK